MHIGELRSKILGYIERNSIENLSVYGLEYRGDEIINNRELLNALVANTMEKDAVTVYCPNELCQAANTATNRFCQHCSTPIPQRYLWAVGEGKSLGNPGDILGDRYYVVNQFILLDSKPGLLPQVPDIENLQTLRPYLRLFPYRLHVPQVYGILSFTEDSHQREVILLEKPPLELSDGVEAKLYPSLDLAWADASSMRQLNWFWQIAQLWQPLASEGVASSLLDPLLLRVNGTILRILELHEDGNNPPTLADLGEFWRANFLPRTQSAIAEFVETICNSLHLGKIHSGEQLVAVLDKGLSQLARHQSNLVKIITKTDTGPQRQRNEDACYPASGNQVSKPPQPSAIAIVCDGIGGHEGGNVASNLAIETIQTQVHQLTDIPHAHIEANMLLGDLESAAALANDKISQRNDSEQRSGRQRMGTTLVMALAIGHEMYITHVGDSRAYLITRQDCDQITVDDDVASREVRLGYALYRDAVSQPASGSLVQALGMGSSNSLHPTAQRFIVDEDCVFLLCSDGLSDYDRVEQNWETEILPILNENKDISEAIDKLVEIANTQNGHDNVTVAIVSNQIKYTEPTEAISPQLVELATTAATEYRTSQGSKSPEVAPSQRTQVLPDTTPAKSAKIPLHWIILPLFVVAGASIGYFLSSSRPISPSPENTPIQTADGSPNPTNSPLPAVGENTSNLIRNIVPGVTIETREQVEFNSIPPTANDPIIAPKGTILRVFDKQEESSPDAVAGYYTLSMQVCQVPEQSLTQPSNLPAPTSFSPTLSPTKQSIEPLNLGREVSISSSKLTPQNISFSRPTSASENPCAKLPARP